MATLRKLTEITEIEMVNQLDSCLKGWFTMRYDIASPFLPNMQNLRKGTKCSKSSSLRPQKLVKTLCFDVSFFIWRTFVLRKISISRPHLGGIVRQNAYLVAESGGNKCQLSYSVEAIWPDSCPRMWPIRHFFKALWRVKCVATTTWWRDFPVRQESSLRKQSDSKPLHLHRWDVQGSKSLRHMSLKYLYVSMSKKISLSLMKEP